VALKVREIVEPLVRRRGLELVDIQFGEGGGSPALRIFADGPGGISLSALEELSRTLGDIMDAEDPVPTAGRYTLEVSSPGLDRPLTRKSHFEAALGELVMVVTSAKIAGSRKHKGVLSGIDNVAVIVQVDGTARTIPLSQVDSANTIYQFEAVERPGKKPAAKAPPNLNATPRRGADKARRGGPTE